MTNLRVLTDRERNRAVLARQRLLARLSNGPTAIEDTLEAVGGLQTQYAPSGYVGLWSRIEGFRRAELDAALESARAVQGTLMRTTIHLVAGRSYWKYAMGIREARRQRSLRLTTAARGEGEPEMRARAGALREALEDGPRDVRELGPAAAGGFIGDPSSWVDLVRVPPSGTWARRRADRLALAQRWVGPEDATEADGKAHLLRTFLAAFGPATLADAASWAGLAVGELRPATADVALVRYRDERGRELLDVPGAPIPDADEPAPVRFLPWYETLFWVHTRHADVLPEVHRGKILNPRNSTSLAAVTVDGRTVGAWRLERDGRVTVELYEDLAQRDRDAVEDERAALERFTA